MYLPHLSVSPSAPRPAEAILGRREVSAVISLAQSLGTGDFPSRVCLLRVVSGFVLKETQACSVAMVPGKHNTEAEMPTGLQQRALPEGVM